MSTNRGRQSRPRSAEGLGRDEWGAHAPRQDELFPWEQGADEADGVERAFEETAAAAVAGSAAGTPSPNRPIAPKEYYSISEVCELVGLKPHVLRYWESQFPVLHPSKNRSGNRVYQRKEIRLILLVKQLLYDEKYTVEGARAKLERLRRGAQLAEVTAHVLEPQLIELVRQDLAELKAILTPPAR